MFFLPLSLSLSVSLLLFVTDGCLKMLRPTCEKTQRRLCKIIKMFCGKPLKKLFFYDCFAENLQKSFIFLLVQKINLYIMICAINLLLLLL